MKIQKVVRHVKLYNTVGIVWKCTSYSVYTLLMEKQNNQRMNWSKTEKDQMWEVWQTCGVVGWCGLWVSDMFLRLFWWWWPFLLVFVTTYKHIQGETWEVYTWVPWPHNNKQRLTYSSSKRKFQFGLVLVFGQWWMTFINQKMLNTITSMNTAQARPKYIPQ